MTNVIQFPKKDWIDEAFKKEQKPYKVTHLSTVKESLTPEQREAELIEERHRD